MSGNLNAHEIESLMDAEIEVHHQEAHRAGGYLRLAVALPAFGIVARRAGVEITMGSVGSARLAAGRHDRPCPCGHFPRHLLAYGVFEPLGGLMDQKVEESAKELLCVKTTLLSSMQGYAPLTAIEFGRSGPVRRRESTFSELETHVEEVTMQRAQTRRFRVPRNGRQAAGTVPPQGNRRSAAQGELRNGRGRQKALNRSSSSASRRVGMRRMAARGRLRTPTS